MYLIFVMMGILLWSSFSKTFLLPSLWTLEMAQFTMTAYYLIGGPYALQAGAHVRMDLFYGNWTARQKAFADALTVFCLFFYLGVLLYGGVESTIYALKYAERSYSAWRPYMSPIKIVMCIGIFLYASCSSPSRSSSRTSPRCAGKSSDVLRDARPHPVRIDDADDDDGVSASSRPSASSPSPRRCPLWGVGGSNIAFSSAIKLMKWYPLLTLPLFIFMGYVLSESRIANDLYRMFHVWMGPVNGGLAIGTIGLMVLISAMNGLSVAGMAIGATIALPELLKRGYDKQMVTGVIQAGSSLGILVPPSVVLVLYAMIARQPVGQLWLAGVLPGLMMAALFVIYIVVRCKLNPKLGPALPPEERNVPLSEKLELLAAGLLPIGLFCRHDGALRQRLDLAGGKLGDRCHRLAFGRRLQAPFDGDPNERRRTHRRSLCGSAIPSAS